MRFIITFISLLIVIMVCGAIVTAVREGPEGIAATLGHAVGTATKAFEDARR